MPLKRLLIIEDEEIARTLYKRLLGQMGVDFDIAASLGDAREFLSSAALYDLLVTDVRLPDGRGTDIVDDFHAKHPRAKILIVTGSPDLSPAQDDSQKLSVPAEWLYKPFELDDFTGAVKRLLAAS